MSCSSWSAVSGIVADIESACRPARLLPRCRELARIVGDASFAGGDSARADEARGGPAGSAAAPAHDDDDADDIGSDKKDANSAARASRKLLIESLCPSPDGSRCHPTSRSEYR